MPWLNPEAGRTQGCIEVVADNTQQTSQLLRRGSKLFTKLEQVVRSKASPRINFRAFFECSWRQIYLIIRMYNSYIGCKCFAQFCQGKAANHAEVVEFLGRFRSQIFFSSKSVNIRRCSRSPSSGHMSSLSPGPPSLAQVRIGSYWFSFGTRCNMM